MKPPIDVKILFDGEETQDRTVLLAYPVSIGYSSKDTILSSEKAEVCKNTCLESKNVKSEEELKDLRDSVSMLRDELDRKKREVAKLERRLAEKYTLLTGLKL